ncbi:hypothetical protein Poly41_48310 [Novipirellula artificiosorum]|uniref:Uncharacterized protein n=1 Tax=Novipirellula artificiosorum TaxID=2528016 RepID=A0A5C6DAB9_9BACT|nr:hypothetical protein Poly41_48310 [Novipirellula artificiosorum]
MDMIDLLGSLLGQKTSGGGRGGDALNDIFRRGSGVSRGGSQSTDISKEGKDLEDLLNVAKDRHSNSGSGDRAPSSSAPTKSAPADQQSQGGDQ